MLTESESTPDAIRDPVRAFLAEHDPAEMPRQDFNNARFDAGLAWVHYPEGLGGLGAPRTLQNVVDAEFAAAGAPGHNAELNAIGLGMAAPTILAYASDEQQQRWLRSLWTGEEIWCQLFSEPGAGSDLAALATRAVQDGEEWVANGQKVWTSLAQHARRALLVARTDPDVPKHQALPPRAAHAGPARPDDAAVDRSRGGPAGGGAAAAATGRGQARSGGLGRQAGLCPAEPGDLRFRGRARRG